MFKDNREKFDKIIKNLKIFSKLEAKVGIFSNSGSVKGVKVLDYATYQEFGTKYIPERSFLRSTADENNYWIDSIQHAAVDIIEGKESAVSALSQAAIGARDDVKKKIYKSDDKWKPLKESTIKQKGSSRPLIDKGFLVNSIKYKISLKS